METSNKLCPLPSHYEPKESLRCRCFRKLCENQSYHPSYDDDDDLPIKYKTEQNTIKILCEQFDEILNSDYNISFLKQFPLIPEHDKRILNCMLLKRSNDALNLENSYIAQKCWEDDKQQRNELLRKHQSNHLDWLKEKQEIEKYLHAQRSDALYKQHENYISTIAHEIQVKKCRFNRRLERLEHERNVMQRQRQLIEKQKTDQNARLRQWNQIEHELQKCERSAELESRMDRANHTRNHYLTILRRRTMEDNQRQRLIHAINYEEIKELERMNMDYLKEKVADCDRRSKQFHLNKMQWIEESRDRAHTTAHLREIIRKSITPDTFSCRN